MKRLLIVLMLLVSAGALFAADLKVTGDAYVRGTKLGKKETVVALNGTESKINDHTEYYDYDFNINAALVANENATVFVKVTYDRNVEGSGYVKDGNGQAEVPSTTGAKASGVLNLERAYINYIFHPAFRTNVGLMAGGQWATTFDDNESNVMRVQAIGALSESAIFIVTIEKRLENGKLAWSTTDQTHAAKKSEKDDMDVYYLTGIFKTGPLTFKPLVAYGKLGYNNDHTTIATAYKTNVAKAVTDMQTKLIAANGQGWTRNEAAFIVAAVALNPAQYTTLLGLGSGGLAGAGYAAATNYETAILTAKIGTKRTDHAYKITQRQGTMGINGDFGMFGFESEFVWKVIDVNSIDRDHPLLATAAGASDVKAIGAYVNAFVKVDPAKIGFVYAYGSADKKNGKFSFGDDFDVLYVMDDMVDNQPDNANYIMPEVGLAGYSVYKPYVEATFGPVNVGVQFGYGKTNAKWSRTIDKTTSIATENRLKKGRFKELDGSVTYNMDANASYTIFGGYSKTNDFTADPTTGKGRKVDYYRIANKMSVKF